MIPSPVVMTSWQRMRNSVLLFTAGVSRRDHVTLYLCRQFEEARKFAPTCEIAAAEWFDVGALADPVW